jgi:hypothetical protein
MAASPLGDKEVYNQIEASGLVLLYFVAQSRTGTIQQKSESQA